MKTNSFFRTVLVVIFAIISLSSYSQKIVWNATGGTSTKMMDFKHYCLRILPDGVRMQNVYSDGSFGPGSFSEYFDWTKVIKDTKGISVDKIAGYQMCWHANQLAYFVVTTDGKMFNVLKSNAYVVSSSNDIPRDKWSRSHWNTSLQIVPNLKYMNWIAECPSLQNIGIYY